MLVKSRKESENHPHTSYGSNMVTLSIIHLNLVGLTTRFPIKNVHKKTCIRMRLDCACAQNMFTFYAQEWRTTGSHVQSLEEKKIFLSISHRICTSIPIWKLENDNNGGSQLLTTRDNSWFNLTNILNWSAHNMARHPYLTIGLVQ